MASFCPPRNQIIPLEIANVIIDKYDSTLNIVDDTSQIYGKTLDGRGIVEYKNGNRYEGEFTNGMLHGTGTLFWTDGVRYSGGFENNQINGKGRYDWPDGSWYEGDVNIGLRNGFGTYATPGEDCVYEGEWKDGLKDGKGVMVFKNGTKYEGTFKNGLKHGYGKVVYPSGNYYEGEWANDKKEGEGTMFWLNENEKYTGGWVNNKQDGWGTHTWLDIKGEGKFLRNRYEGQWKYGMRNGMGVFYYSNGSKYEGEWEDNLKEGFAVFTYEDGRIFRGLYKNDKMIPNAVKESPKSEFDFNVTHNQIASVEDITKKQSGSMRDTSRKGTKKQIASEKLEKIEVNKPVELEVNPYDNMLDIMDLFPEEDEEQVQDEITEVKKLLLRYHTNLKSWYRVYTAKQQVNSEESFALTSKMFWKMLRDAKVLSPKVTIAGFNRLFIQGNKNVFTLHTTERTLKKTLLFAKKEYLSTLSESEREHSEVHIEEIPEEELFVADYKTDVHDENTILFFRHFVDALVRVAYLKYGGAPNFAKGIEKVLVKVQATQELKKKSKFQLEEEAFLTKSRAVSEAFRERLKALFQRCPNKDQAFLFETIDYTMTVKDIIQLFEKAGIIKDEEDREIVIHSAERAYDPEDTYTHPPPSETAREKSSTSRPLAHKMEKLGDLLTSEVVFLEFYDIFLFGVLRKDGSSLREDEAKKRIANALKSLEEQVKVKEEDVVDEQERGPNVKWPYSRKDYMFEHLTTEKEKREREYALARQKKYEREAEEKEAKAMEKEDFDIGDEYIRPPTKQSQETSDVYAESYNEF